MKLRNIVVLALVSQSTLSPVRADNNPYSALSNFAKITSTNITSTTCVIKTAADFEAYKPYLPIFRDNWLNRDYSLDFYRQRQKQVFLFSMLKQFAEVITEGLYANGGPKDCMFSVSVKYFDLLGQSKMFDAITWRFTQERASKVDWKQIDPKNFPSIAVDYQLLPQVSDWVSDEPSFMSTSPSSNECDKRFLRANAIFIRAVTYCAKDFLDTPAGFYALAKSRQCVPTLTEPMLHTAFLAAAKEVDDVATTGGKDAACRFVDQVEREIVQLALP